MKKVLVPSGGKTMFSGRKFLPSRRVFWAGVWVNLGWCLGLRTQIAKFCRFGVWKFGKQSISHDITAVMDWLMGVKLFKSWPGWKKTWVLMSFKSVICSSFLDILGCFPFFPGSLSIFPGHFSFFPWNFSIFPGAPEPSRNLPTPGDLEAGREILELWF